MTELTVLTAAMKAELIEKILGFKKKDAVLSPYSHAGIKVLDNFLSYKQ